MSDCGFRIHVAGLTARLVVAAFLRIARPADSFGPLIADRCHPQPARAASEAMPPIRKQSVNAAKPPIRNDPQSRRTNPEGIRNRLRRATRGANPRSLPN